MWGRKKSDRLALPQLDASGLRLRPLDHADRRRFSEWKSVDSPLFIGYDYSHLKRAESLRWFHEKTKHNAWYFAIDLPERPFVGFLGAKQIDFTHRDAKLGIVLDPSYWGQGVGTRAMQRFLQFYFEERNMHRLYLDVNAFNARARRLYQSMGFIQIDTRWESFENQDLDFYVEVFDRYAPFFRKQGDRWFSKIYEMERRKN